MKRGLWYVVLGFCFVIAAQSLVYALDPPHSLNSAVDCGECHGESLFQTNPGSMTPEELRQAYNAMCKRCHFQPVPPYHASDSPLVNPHDSITTGSSEFTFQTGCTDCHHPHLQTQQLYWGRRTTGSPGQLFTGVVTAINYDSVPYDKTIVTYDPASLTVKAGSVWDTTDGLTPPTSEELQTFPNGVPGEHTDDDCTGPGAPLPCCDGPGTGTCIEIGLHNLENKMHGFEDGIGRGAIFLPYKNSHYNSRTIEEIDTTANTITFKGTVPSNYETYMTNPSYGFAIYLGLAMNIQVRHPAADPNRPVYLFDRTGVYGFGHQDYCEPEYPGVTNCTDSTPSGLCQACHTQTDFYKNDGTGLSHYNGSDCMECHDHFLGFKSGSTVDHTGTTIALLRSPAECTGCHDPGGNSQYIFEIHQENCDDCHVQPLPGMRLDYGTPVTVDLTIDNSDCVDCHENGSTLTYQTDFDNLSTGHQVADHSGLTGNTSGTTVTTSCYTATYCHAASTKNDIATVIHSSCDNCHFNISNNGSLVNGTTGSTTGDVGDATGHVIYTTSTCDACHLAAGYFDSHTHDHSTTVIHRDGIDKQGTTDCEGCHYNGAPQLDTWSDINVLHQSNCALCHDATRDVNPGSPVGITVQDRIASGSGNKVNPTGCLHCHQDRSAAHMPDHKLTGMVTGSTTNCVPCHDPTPLDNETHYLITVHVTCGKCHEASSGGGPLWNYGPSGLNTGGTIDEYVDYESIDNNPDPTYGGGSCTDCHVNYSNDFGSEHQVISHTYIDGIAICTDCHSGDMITVVHATPGCTDCHVNSTTNGSLVSGTYGSAAAPEHTMGATSDCATCHGASGGFNYDSDFGGAHSNVDHRTTGAANAVATSPDCTNACHPQTTAADIIAITHQDNCLDCHNNTDSDGRLHAGDISGSIADGTSYGTAAGHGFDSTSSCVDCHENGGTLTYLSDFDGANGHQVQDHDGLTGTTSGTPMYDCNNCHANSTKNDIASVVHNTALCADCHTGSGDLVGAVTNGTTLNHVMGQTSNCNECHGTYAGDFETHIYGSTTDHAPGGSGNTVYQLASDFSGGVLCDNCHASTLSDWSNVYDLHNVATNGTGSCATCHNSTRPGDTDGGGVQAIIHANETTNPCLSCHVSYAGDHSDHVVATWVIGNGECTGCHDQTSQNDHTQLVGVIHNNDCDMCHTDSGGNDYTLLAGSSAEGHETGPNTCNTCHNGANSKPDYAADFTAHLVQNHTWVGDNVECSECHTGDIVNLDANPDVHNDNCENCHINLTTDGRLHAGDDSNSVAGAASYGTALYPTHTIGTTSTCADCHSSHSSSFTTGHQNEDHLNLVSAPTSCTNCHDDAMIAGTNTHSDACTYCHVNTDTDGRLVNGATGTAAGDVGDATGHTWGSTSSCADCHSNHDTSFTTGHGNDETHANLVNSTDCTGCHEDAMIAGADTHSNACTYCHVSTDTDGSLVSGAAGTATGDVGFADSHTWGSTSSCVDCHENGGAYTYLSDYGGANGHQVMDHDGLTGTTSATEMYDCNNCHAAATKVEIAETTHTACSNCHNSSGALVGARPNGTTVGHVVGSTSNCADCHGTYAGDFETHIYSSTTDHAPGGSGNTVYQLAGTDEMVGTVCDACHGATLTDWANVYALHNVSTNGAGACATCHNSTRPSDTDTTGIQDLIHANETTNPCISCHVSKAADHADHVLATWVIGNAECTGCHDQGGAADEDQYLKVIHGNGVTSDCAMCHTNPGSSDYTLLAGSSAEGHETGPNTCNTCHNGANGHPDYAADFASHLVQNHAKVGGMVTCTDCHSGDIVNLDANPDVHADNCQDCHNNTGTDGNLHAGDVAGSVQNATSWGTAALHTIGTTSDCADCHAAWDSNFTTGHQQTDHDGIVITSSCSSCHGSPADGAAAVTNALTHNDVCATCHEAPTGNDGRLLDGTKAGTPFETTSVGDASGHGWGTTSSCADCHGTHGSSFDTGHQVTDHDGLTGTTNSTLIYDCNNCHAAATKLEIAETTHSLCTNCHNNTGNDGDLVGNKPTGTTVGHTIGSTSNCAECHSSYAGDFETHIYGDTTDHAPGGSGSTLNMQPGDLLGGSQPCSGCHIGTLDNFGDVYTTHDKDTNGFGACATCHNSTRTLYTDSTGVQDIIHANETTNSCVGCHTNKTTSHGGHGDGDFAWDANCDDCHGPNTLRVVQDVHSASCIMCHDADLGSATNEDIGSTTYGVDGDARLADGDSGTFTSTCTTCHPENGNSGGAEPFNTWVQTHHDESLNNYSANGECDSCHTDPRPNYSGGVNIAYKQLACVNCHVVDDLSGGIKAVSNLLKDPGDGADSTRANNTQVDIAGHAWPNTPLATGIKNYGSCFYCHGQAGNIAGRASKVTVPLHALPTPTDINTGAEVGAPNVRDGNEIGGGGWQIDCWSGTKGVYGTWSINGSAEGCSGADFRGGEGSIATAWNNAYFPLGKTTINIGWGSYALPKKATNNTEYKVNVGGLIGNTKFNIIAGLKWGYVADIQHDGNSSHVIPIFDDAASLSSLGVDTLSENTGFSVNWTGETGPIDTRTITVDVSSDDITATLYLVYGGHVLATGSSGTISTTVNLATEATNVLGAASVGSLYASPNAGIIWVVSDKGGSITLSGHASQGQGHN